VVEVIAVDAFIEQVDNYKRDLAARIELGWAIEAKSLGALGMNDIAHHDRVGHAIFLASQRHDGVVVLAEDARPISRSQGLSEWTRWCL
jgi:hypothetical protein